MFLDVNAAQGSHGALLIHKAVYQENVSINTMENLITQGVFSVNVRNDFNATPLHYAAFYGMQAMSVMLIKWGADLEARMSPIPITGNTDDRPLTPRNLCDLQGYGWCGLLGTDGNTSSSLESFELCSIQVMRVTMIPDILRRTLMT